MRVWTTRMEAYRVDRDAGQGHRRAGVPGLGLLHAIHGERTDGVDAELVESGARRGRGGGGHGDLILEGGWLSSTRKVATRGTGVPTGPHLRTSALSDVDPVDPHSFFVEPPAERMTIDRIDRIKSDRSEGVEG